MTRHAVLQAKEYRDWLEEMAAAQAKLALHEEPAFLIEELQRRYEPVNKLFQKLSSKSAPKPPAKDAPAKDGEAPKDGEEPALKGTEGDEPKGDGSEKADGNGGEGATRGDATDGDAAAGEGTGSDAQHDEL